MNSVCVVSVDKQVREYDPFIVVETPCDSLASSKGFNSVAGYVFNITQLHFFISFSFFFPLGANEDT